MGRRSSLQPSLLTLQERDLHKYANLKHLPYPSIKELKARHSIPTFELDINQTISELAYATHSFYRYYGKYPSILGGVLIDRHGGEGPIFDNFLGCGTTLVEAQIRGISASGIDINPLAVLASKVKVYPYTPSELKEFLLAVVKEAPEIARKDARIAVPNWPPVDKWFDEEAQSRLARIKARLLREPLGVLREAGVVCFLAIIRRCSKAYDGEVRPHLNLDKTPRDPYQAFTDKALEIIAAESEYLELLPSKVTAQAFCGDACEEALDKYFPWGTPSLTISHPPYLNCFNYLAAFSLENAWSTDFPEVWGDLSLPAVRSRELICWPATNKKILSDYFVNLKKVYLNLRRWIRRGSKLAIVIGDATMHGNLISVHDDLTKVLPKCGFEPIEILYRTTHYGIGKYAYSTRANYHGEAGKKDGVLVAIAV